MLVDGEDQDQRKQQAHQPTGQDSKQADQGGLGKDDFFQLAGGGAQHPEYSQLPAPFECQGQQGIGDTQSRHQDGDGFQGIRDGKSPVKNAEHGLLQNSVGCDQKLIALLSQRVP